MAVRDCAAPSHRSRKLPACGHKAASWQLAATVLPNRARSFSVSFFRPGRLAGRSLTFRRSYQVAKISLRPLAYQTGPNSMTKNAAAEKVARFQAALNQLIERVAEDRYVLAIV